MTKNQLAEFALTVRQFESMVKLLTIADGMVKRGEALNVIAAIRDCSDCINRERETLVQVAREIQGGWEGRCCTTCGAVITEGTTKMHNEWHNTMREAKR